MLYVVGDEDAVFGFGLLGVAGRVVHTAEEAQQALAAALENDSVAIIFLTANLADAMREWVDHIRVSQVTPLLVEIPASHGELAHSSLRQLVQQSLGVHLDG